MYANDFDYDVIVIGAGISGLTAAFNINQRDPSLGILVLEASDTVGGRTKPVPMESPSKKVIQDSGGHFVSKTQSHLMALLNKLKVNIIDYNFPGQSLTEQAPEDFVRSEGALLLVGNDMSRDELICFYRKLEDLCEQVSLENPMGSVQSEYLDSITMDQYISENLNSDDIRQHFRNVVRTTCGSEAVDISPLFYLAYCNSTGGLLTPHLRQLNGARSSYIEGGVSNFIDRLVTELGEHRIIIDTPVTKISRSERDVTIYTIKDKYRCRCAIMAVPPPELISINFDPPLNIGKVQVLHQMKAKRWMKFIATYKEAFWQKKQLNGDVLVNVESSQCPVVIVLNVSTEDCAALMGLVDVKRLQNANNYDIEVLQQLAKYFGSEALEPLDYIERHWPECLNEGPMCTNPKVGIMKSFHEIRRPIGRLYFAGSETATYWYGHMGGAVQTGLRAALEVLYEIRPQVLCYKDFAELQPRRQIIPLYKELASVQEPQNAGWLTRRMSGVITTVGAYLGTDVVSNVYESIFGRRGGNNNDGGGAST